MTGPREEALFLEKRSYRRRRLMDALRLLPIVGLLLWMLPLFWPSGPTGAAGVEPVPMSRAVIYVFAVWAGLILAALALWIALWRNAPAGDATPVQAPGGDGP